MGYCQRVTREEITVISSIDDCHWSQSGDSPLVGICLCLLDWQACRREVAAARPSRPPWKFVDKLSSLWKRDAFWNLGHMTADLLGNLQTIAWHSKQTHGKEQSTR